MTATLTPETITTDQLTDVGFTDYEANIMVRDLRSDSDRARSFVVSALDSRSMVQTFVELAERALTDPTPA